MPIFICTFLNFQVLKIVYWLSLFKEKNKIKHFGFSYVSDKWLNSRLALLYGVVVSIWCHFLQPASILCLPPIALSWALLYYDICALKKRKKEKKKEKKQQLSVLHSEGIKPRQTFCQNLAISQGITSKLVVYTIKLHPFFKNKTN